MGDFRADIKQRHDEIVYKYQMKQREAKEKEYELAELKRLKEKYEGKQHRTNEILS